MWAEVTRSEVESDLEQGESGLCPSSTLPPPPPHWPVARGQIRDLG